MLALISEYIVPLDAVNAETWPCLFRNHQVHVARHFAAVTSGLDFIFSDIQNLANMFSRPRERSMCA